MNRVPTGEWGGWEHSCSEPSFPTGPRAFLASQKATSQNHTPKFHISLSALKPVPQTDLHPLWNVHFRVSESTSSHSSSLLQDLGCAVLSLHVLAQENRCCVTLDHGGVQGGTCPRRVASLNVLQKSRSTSSLLFQNTWLFSSLTPDCAHLNAKPRIPARCQSSLPMVC